MAQADFSLQRVATSFFLSLIWVAVLVTIAVFFRGIGDVAGIDFLHVNPHRSQLHAATLPFLFAPFNFVIIVLGVMLVFGLSQFAMATASATLLRAYGSIGLVGVVLSVPVVTVITWYCYDYLTPSDFVTE
jgi:hypothetical protein